MKNVIQDNRLLFSHPCNSSETRFWRQIIGGRQLSRIRRAGPHRPLSWCKSGTLRAHQLKGERHMLQSDRPVARCVSAVRRHAFVPADLLPLVVGDRVGAFPVTARWMCHVCCGSVLVLCNFNMPEKWPHAETLPKPAQNRPSRINNGRPRFGQQDNRRVDSIRACDSSFRCLPALINPAKTAQWICSSP